MEGGRRGSGPAGSGRAHDRREGGEAACNPPRGRVPSSDQVLAGT